MEINYAKRQENYLVCRQLSSKYSADKRMFTLSSKLPTIVVRTKKANWGNKCYLKMTCILLEYRLIRHYCIYDIFIGI